MAAPRSKFACASCTRRKVRCSKTIPCSNCIRRGEQDLCSTSPPTPRPRTLNEVTAILSPPSSIIDQREIDGLRSRILELETQLQRATPPMEMVRLNEGSLQSVPSVALLPDPSIFAAAPAPSHTVDASGERVNEPDSVVKDAASILEFLAWGRKKHDYNTQLSPEASAHALPDLGDVGDDEPATLSHVIQENSPVGHLQLLLPARRQLWELVKYHQDCLLWYHCSYFPPSFGKQLEVFWDRFNGVITGAVNLQWLALLFAIITGSITCAPDNVAAAWGFRAPERQTLSRRWCRAVYTCLNAADYSAKQSILSVQALSTLTISVHILGFSNMHSIHLAAAIRIAQGLGLHRLGDETPGSTIELETGRRLWMQLCCQDWFSIPFSDTYLISLLHSQSAVPLNCYDDDMQPLPEAVPTSTTYCRILARIAAIMPQLQDDLATCNTPFTKYEQVIKWDKRMRALSTSERPFFLTPNVTLDPAWPPYIPWARRSLAVTSSHKIIMIHRSFLSDSFSSPAFSFTRRTCLAAAKTIIKEVKIAAAENEPNFWIYQAFTVAASIIFILDILHRDPAEAEYDDHKRLAEDGLAILQQCQNSMIAKRGMKLLSSLLEEISVVTRTYNNRKRGRDGERASTSQPRFNVLAFVKSFTGGLKQADHTTLEQSDVEADAHSASGLWSHQTSMEIDNTVTPTMPVEQFNVYGPDVPIDPSLFPQGFENSTPFENLLYLANHDFSFFGA